MRNLLPILAFFVLAVLACWWCVCMILGQCGPKMEVNNTNIGTGLQVENQRVVSKITESYKNVELHLFDKIREISTGYHALQVDLNALKDVTKNWFSEFEIRKNAMLLAQEELKMEKLQVEYDMQNLHKQMALLNEQAVMMKTAYENEVRRNDYLNSKLSKYGINVHDDAFSIKIQCVAWREKIEKNEIDQLLQQLEAFLNKAPNPNDALVIERVLFATQFRELPSDVTSSEYRTLRSKLNNGLWKLIQKIEEHYA